MNNDITPEIISEAFDLKDLEDAYDRKQEGQTEIDGLAAEIPDRDGSVVDQSVGLDFVRLLKSKLNDIATRSFEAFFCGLTLCVIQEGHNIQSPVFGLYAHILSLMGNESCIV